MITPSAEADGFVWTTPLLQQRLRRARMSSQPLRYALQARSEPPTLVLGDTFTSASEPSEFGCFLSFVGSTFTDTPSVSNPAKLKSQRAVQPVFGDRQRLKLECLRLSYYEKVYHMRTKRNTEHTWHNRHQNPEHTLKTVEPPRLNLQFLCLRKQTVPLEDS